MRPGARLAVLLIFLLLAAVGVWLLAARGESRRAERAARETPAEAPVRDLPAELLEALGQEPQPQPDEETEEAESTGTIRGRVVAQGEPVAGAYVYMSGEHLKSLPQDTETDADGAFTFSDFGIVHLGAAHEDHGPAMVEIDVEEGGTREVVIELPPAESFDLLVLDGATGAPVHGARVIVLRAGRPGTLECRNNFFGDDFYETVIGEPEEVDLALYAHMDIQDMLAYDEWGAWIRIPEAMTDPEGRLHVTGLPPGTVDVVVAHPDFVSTRLRGRDVSAAEPAVVRLSRGGSLRVLSPRVGGRVAEGYYCTVTRGGFQSLPVAVRRIDGRGQVRFPILPAGVVKVTIGKSAGWLGTSDEEVPFEEVDISESESTADEVEIPPDPLARPLVFGTVRIEAGKETVLDLTEGKSARIEGRVIGIADDVDEHPVVLLGGEDFRDQMGMVLCKPPDRTFRFDGVAPGRYRVFTLVDESGSATADCDVSEAGEVVTVELRFGTAAIAGRVTGPDGKPICLGQIVLEAVGARRAGPVTSVAELLEQMAGFATSGQHGEFRIAGLKPGRYRVLCGFEGRLDVARVTLADGERARVDFRFDESRQHALTVRIKGPDGAPVDGHVSIAGEGGGWSEAIALFDPGSLRERSMGYGTKDVHGFHLAPGRYVVGVTAAGYARSGSRTLDLSGDRELTFQLDRGVSVELTLVGPEGPLAGRAADLRDGTGHSVVAGGTIIETLSRPEETRTDGAGKLVVDHVAPGRYSVHLDGRPVGRVDVHDSPVNERILID